MTQAIPFNAVEDAIFSWIVGGSGVPAKRVYWMHQRSPRADSSNTPFIAMMFTTLERFGHDWIDVQDNPSPSPGQEILRIARGLRTATVSVEFFASKVIDPTTGAADPTVSTLGISVAANVMAALPLFRDALNAAGVGVLSFGPARATSIAVPVGLDPRARLEIYVNLASEVSVPDTYIEFVDVVANTPSWTPSTQYETPTTVTNVGRLYRLIANGTSASSGGPTTNASDIVDGTAHWKYLGDGTGSDIWSPFDPTP